MEGEKDRFGEKMTLVERAKEDIYFAARDRELIEKLKSKLKKVAVSDAARRMPVCPKCEGRLEGYSLMGFALDRCEQCGGVWLDPGELEGLLKRASRSPLVSLIEWFIEDSEKTAKKR